MFLQFVLLGAVLLTIQVSGQCPLGGSIYYQGVTNQGKIDVVNAHNKYRSLIMAGKVPGQPKGVGLKTISYDNALARGATAVSKTCEMEHEVEDDELARFPVGQNLYSYWSSSFSTNQNWTEAVESWFNEYVDYKYSTGSKNGNVVGHYTQVVWADTYLIGCDFIVYEDVYEPDYPYTKLYTCNYGPAGNMNNRAPYRTS